MQAQFQLLCFLVMIPMLFSVPWLAANRFSPQQVARNLAVAGLGIAAASVAWLLGGYSLAFHQEVISDPLPVLVQLEFALYALVMLLGTALAARRTLFFPLFAALCRSPTSCGGTAGWLSWEPSTFLGAWWST